MATLPSTGDSNWGATLNTWLTTSHNTDGSIKNSAGSNGIDTIEVLTQAAYDALGSYDSQTLYIING